MASKLSKIIAAGLMLAAADSWAADRADARTVERLAALRHTYNAGIFGRPFYAGIGAGYGSTTWYGLVPRKNRQNAVMSMSVPLKSSEGGGTGTIFVGFDIVPEFGLELGYLQYPKAKLDYDPDSFFTFDHNLSEVTSHTQVYYGVFKVQYNISDTAVRIYSGLGGGLLYRSDAINKHYKLSPTFTTGVSYGITPHWMVDVSGDLTEGYGASEFCPTDDYMPFAYSLFGRLAYRF